MCDAELRFIFFCLSVFSIIKIERNEVQYDQKMTKKDIKTILQKYGQ